MKLFTILSLSFIGSTKTLPPVNVTENEDMVNSVDRLIGDYLVQNSELITYSNFENSESIDQVTPSAKKVSELEAKSFFKYASSAYCSKDSILNWNCVSCHDFTKGVDEVSYFTGEEFHSAGYLAVNPSKEHIVVAYRGTRIYNWLSNLNIQLVSANLTAPYTDAKIHVGFNEMADSLIQPTIRSLQRALQSYPHFKVMFVGHSLGGALATLSAWKVAEAGIIGWERINLITYGQPRLGNMEFANYLNTKPWASTRVTSYADLVTISPGRAFGYAHHQYNMHIDANGKVVDCSEFEEDKRCISNFIIPSLTSHYTFWGERVKTRC